MMFIAGSTRGGRRCCNQWPPVLPGSGGAFGCGAARLSHRSCERFVEMKKDGDFDNCPPILEVKQH
jgi:hypothetical protein